jgi:hypothetical protein
MANLRNPTPHSAAWLATGAGDLATGVAGLMRAVSAMSGTRPRPARRNRPAPPPPDPDLAWSAATHTGRSGRPVDADGRVVEDLPPDEDGSPWAAATRAAAREQQRRDAEARQQKQRDAEARAQQRDAEARAQQRDVEARAQQRDAEARAQQRADSGIDRGGSAPARGPRTGRGAGIGDDVWAAATADGPAVDHDDAGDDARSGEV